MKREGFLGVTLFFLTLSVFFAFSHTANASDAGRKLFIEKRCYSCHTINAEAEAIEKEKAEFAKAKGAELKEDEKEEKEKKGGDLSDVATRRDSKWIADFIQKPKPYFKSGSKCKRNAKKKYRKRFKGTSEELELLVTYIANLKYKKQHEKDFESCLKE